MGGRGVNMGSGKRGVGSAGSHEGDPVAVRDFSCGCEPRGTPETAGGAGVGTQRCSQAKPRRDDSSPSVGSVNLKTRWLR